MASRVNTSFTLIPNQKYRRSSRRSSHVSNTLDSDSQPLSALGNFRALPLEIFQIILRYLSVKDVSMLSMVSKTVSQHIINYISTSSGSKRLLLQDFHNLELPGKRQDSAVLEHYRSLGLLFKRCTLLLPTKERLKYIHKILAETLTAGWDELECHRVFNFLCELTDLSRKMQTIVFSKPGQVVWQKMVEEPTDESSLKGLADAIKLLYDTGIKEWTADDVISLIDELSVVPREWLLENNARLLILSGNDICFTFMASKAVNGRTAELARLIVFLALLQALEQIDNVGENDQAYDGKEHQNENIQHDGVLGRGGLWIAGKCEL
ncbi:F-box only protein 47 [Myotis brandtii]|uniref:F-box only protein 47 n=1 Tax=Myotis brandtii TaxID=109478 RepID=S7MLK0_MYOBR|nr:F-box only protein 47 [Myotis brandtii]